MPSLPMRDTFRVSERAVSVFRVGFPPIPPPVPALAWSLLVPSTALSLSAFFAASFPVTQVGVFRSLVRPFRPMCGRLLSRLIVSLSPDGWFSAGA